MMSEFDTQKGFDGAVQQATKEACLALLEKVHHMEGKGMPNFETQKERDEVIEEIQVDSEKKKEWARKLKLRTEALSILDDAQSYHKIDNIVLLGNGSFKTKSGNPISPYEVLHSYSKLCELVNKAYISLQNSI